MNQSRHTPIAFAISAIVLLAACKGQQRVSSLNNSPDTVPETTTETGNVVSLPCIVGGSNPAPFSKEHKTLVRTYYKLDASWCFPAQQSGELKLMFIVDTSGSMLGNDPTVNGTCGRFDAMKALIGKIKAAQRSDRDKVEVALVSFASTARTVSPFTSLDKFLGTLTAETACGANGATNYEAALQMADGLITALSPAPKPESVAVYLISDGLPTVSGTGTTQIDPYGRGKLAADAIRPRTAAFNAVYLASVDPFSGSGQPPVDPKQYLSTITGDEKRVALVTNAADLAAAITKFEVPAAGIDKASLAISLAAGGQTKPVALADLKGDATATDGKWQVLTDTFELIGREGEFVANIVKIDGKRTDGSKIEATATINLGVYVP